VLIIRRSKLHYTASGIITPIGGRLVHRSKKIGVVFYIVNTVATRLTICAVGLELHINWLVLTLIICAQLTYSLVQSPS